MFCSASICWTARSSASRVSRRPRSPPIWSNDQVQATATARKAARRRPAAACANVPTLIGQAPLGRREALRAAPRTAAACWRSRFASPACRGRRICLEISCEPLVAGRHGCGNVRAIHRPSPTGRRRLSSGCWRVRRRRSVSTIFSDAARLSSPTFCVDGGDLLLQPHRRRLHRRPSRARYSSPPTSWAICSVSFSFCSNSATLSSTLPKLAGRNRHLRGVGVDPERHLDRRQADVDQAVQHIAEIGKAKDRNRGSRHGQRGDQHERDEQPSGDAMIPAPFRRRRGRCRWADWVMMAVCVSSREGWRPCRRTPGGRPRIRALARPAFAGLSALADRLQPEMPRYALRRTARHRGSFASVKPSVTIRRRSSGDRLMVSCR